MPLGALFDPLWSGPSRYGRRLADMVDPATGGADGDRGYIRPFIGGALEGAGDVLSDMTSPVSVASYLTGSSGLLGRLKSAARPAGSVVEPTARAAKTAINYSDDASDLGRLYDRMGPEFVPIGGEKAFNTVRAARQASERANVKQMADSAEQAYRRQHGGIRPATSSDDIAEQEFKEVMSRRADAKKRPRAPKPPAEGRWTSKDISDAMSGMGPNEGVPIESIGPTAGGLERAMEAIRRQQAIEAARQRVLRMRPSVGPLPEGF